MNKRIKDILLGLIIGIVLTATGVFASIMYNANEIKFTPTDDAWEVDNIESAINDIKNNYVPKSTYTDKEIVYDMSYTGSVQKVVIPVSGTYKFEAWGASGDTRNSGMISNTQGFGAYTSGEIHLDMDTEIFVYVGGRDTYNGGGKGETYGGGATDFRTVKDNIYSRIMVAAGGGGGIHITTSSYSSRGDAGGLNGYTPSNSWSSYLGRGATQYSGGATGSSGAVAYNFSMVGVFGQGGYDSISGSASGGGGGWYGGGHGRHPGSSWSGGGGGSSYISGHAGCLAIRGDNNTSLLSGCSTSSTSIECSVSYTGYSFINTSMIDGRGYKWTTSVGSYVGMPSFSGTTLMPGNNADGHAKITLVSLD